MKKISILDLMWDDLVFLHSFLSNQKHLLRDLLILFLFEYWKQARPLRSHKRTIIKKSIIKSEETHKYMWFILDVIVISIRRDNNLYHQIENKIQNDDETILFIPIYLKNDSQKLHCNVPKP